MEKKRKTNKYAEYRFNVGERVWSTTSVCNVEVISRCQTFSKITKEPTVHYSVKFDNGTVQFVKEHHLEKGLKK